MRHLLTPFWALAALVVINAAPAAEAALQYELNPLYCQSDEELLKDLT